ncbi:MAG TPA: Gfo/Idh/MocA family oxidoreductase [Candidatus Fimivicinus intestinavium]|nr:Gfo/Idh/MocA family oxidoreductase [Candidatus Fimivicinus intestinavium]
MKSFDERKVGVAIIGCGAISAYHMEALRLIPEAQIVVCCDIVQERAEKAAAGAADVTADYAKAIDRSDVDLVFVLTPNCLHREIAMFAAERGKHVFVQKPFAMTSQQCRDIICAAEQNHVKLFVSFMHRYFEESRWAREYIASGKLGQIYMAHIRNSLPGSDYSTWQYDSAQCGLGGAIIDVGVHGIDLVRYLLGDIEEVVFASKGQKVSSREINGQTIYPDNEDWALAQYRLKSGAMVSHQISWVQKWHCNRYTMEIHGSNGSIYLRTGYGPLAVTSPGVSQAGSMTFPALAAVPFGYRQHREVIDAVRFDRAPTCTGADGLYTIETVERILQSARTIAG